GPTVRVRSGGGRRPDCAAETACRTGWTRAFEEETAMSVRLSSRPLPCTVAVGLAIVASSTASADFVDPGFDFFETVSASTFVTIGDTQVALKGIQLGTISGQYLGDTDTIVERLTGTTFDIGASR